MADAEADETNLIDQLANVELGDESVADDGGQKSTDAAAGDTDDQEAAAKRRAQKKLEKTDWKKKSPEELFAQFDIDGSGSIDFDEFKACLPQLGHDLSEAKAYKYFRQCDTDGSGEIDLAEFKVALFILDPDGGNTVGFRPNSLLGPRDAFDLYDQDRSGTLDEDEFALALEYMKMPVNDGMLERLFAKYDADGSGSIEYPEFRTAWLGLADPKRELEARNIGSLNLISVYFGLSLFIELFAN